MMAVSDPDATPEVHVVIPCYRVSSQILQVLSQIGPEISRIWVIDDACPEGTADIVEATISDPRVEVLRNKENLGVGGATKRGFALAEAAGAQVVVKMDGDGQMDADLIPALVRPLFEGSADYSKGNRFNSLAALKSMPRIRIFGNAVLSFWSKIATGYWSVNDPTNGFLAMSVNCYRKLEMGKVADRYFFESDLLFRLRLSNARVTDISMNAIYGSEVSNLRIWRIILSWPFLHLRNFLGRLGYQYYLREWSIASLELPLGIMSFSTGAWLGVTAYLSSLRIGDSVTAGQVTVASLLVILGTQLLLAFVNYDIASEPRSRS
ncbi:glycosyltransferase family 2 protein [Aquiluna sp.]|nr:glycosyltransferase family 2 protein [Aquiluna sp.]